MWTPSPVTSPVPGGMMKTFGIAKPRATHWVTASCERVECLNYLNGWVTEVDERTELGGSQAHYVRSSSGRSFVEERTPDGLTRFTFRAGQPCFAEHRVEVEREPIFLVRPGDRRHNVLGLPGVDLRLAERAGRIHTRPEFWVEECAETLDSVRTVREKG